MPEIFMILAAIAIAATSQNERSLCNRLPDIERETCEEILSDDDEPPLPPKVDDRKEIAWLLPEPLPAEAPVRGIGAISANVYSQPIEINTEPLPEIEPETLEYPDPELDLSEPVSDPLAWRTDTTFYGWLDEAKVPEYLWHEFSIIAACESRYDPGAIGDYGAAKGLYQIHWQSTWADWANTQWRLWYEFAFNSRMIDVSDFDERYDPAQDKFVYFGYDEWDNPIKNIQLAYIMNVFYDAPRGEWWRQWNGHPNDRCVFNRDELDEVSMVERYTTGKKY